MIKRLLRSPEPAEGGSQPAPASGGTSAGRAKKPQKTSREIELEIENSRLQDERDTLKTQNSELEKFAKGLGAGKKPATAGKAGNDAGNDAGKAWLDWEKFANEL
jgi:hypothetical protein